MLILGLFDKSLEYLFVELLSGIGHTDDRVGYCAGSQREAVDQIFQAASQKLDLSSLKALEQGCALTIGTA